MMSVALKHNVLKIPQTPYVCAGALEYTQAQAAIVFPQEGMEVWENQKWWHEMLPKHDKGLRDGYGKLNGVHWRRVAKPHMEVGLIGSRQQFKEIPSCLPDDIRNREHIPPHNMTRIVLDNDVEIGGRDEQLLICARSGEKELFTRLDSHWAWNGVYTEVTDDGVSVVEIANPRFITQYEVFARASKMVQEIQGVERCVREFFGEIDPNIEDLILSYDGYPTRQEKAQAEERRQTLMRSLTKSVTEYHLPKPAEAPKAPPAAAPAATEA